MAPVQYASCADLGLVATVPTNDTMSGRKGTEQSDLQALLYIVITLLFYSLGIIIGIISYLKREKREMMEDKTYDDFFTMKLDPFVAVKSERVQQFAERIKFFEEKKRLREEEAERQRLLRLNEPSGSSDGLNSRRISHVSLLPSDNSSMQFKHKSCQTDDIEKETSTLGSRARKIVKILTPTPSRRTLKIHIPRSSKKKSKHKDSPKGGDQTLSSPSLPDEDQLSCISVDSSRPRSTSLLTPTICLPPEDMTSRSTISDSPPTGRHMRSPVPYMDASTDDDGDRATTPLIHETV